jgi:hypothetical protein
MINWPGSCRALPSGDYSHEVFKGIPGRAAVVLVVFTAAAAIPDITGYIRIGRV